MAQKVMKDHNLKYGFTFTGANYEGGTVLGLEFMRTNGANPIQGNTIEMNSPQAIQGLTVQRGLITSGVSPQAVAEYMEGTVEGPFVAGDSVFLRNWNYMFGVFPDPKQSKVHPSQVGVTSVPRASTSIAPVNVGGGWNMYINKYSNNQDAAWKLIQFMTSPAQQLYTLDTIQYMPTLSSLINSPKVAKQDPFSGIALARRRSSRPWRQRRIRTTRICRRRCRRSSRQTCWARSRPSRRRAIFRPSSGRSPSGPRPRAERKDCRWLRSSCEA